MQVPEPERDEVVAGPSDCNFGFAMATVFALIGILGLFKDSSHAPIWLGAAAVEDQPASLKLDYKNSFELD